MVDETTQETPTEETPVADAPDQKASETTQEETGLLGDDKPVDNAPIPEGLDADIFDAETRTLKESAVVERLKQNQADIEKWKKQANDMRRKLSKGVEAPDKIEAYAENYVPEERYDFVMDDNETDVGKHIHGVLAQIDEFAFNHGMSVETTKDLKNLYMKYAEDVQIIDARSDEEKAESRKVYLDEQRKLLGENAETILKENKKFAEDYGLWTDDERKYILGEMNKTAVANTIWSKVRKLFGQSASDDIPVRGVSVSGLADDRTLADEYYNPATSDARRMEILQLRRDAGRTSSLPMPR